MRNKYDIIVVGGGHAGCEAASSAAKLCKSVLLITMNMANVGKMSCNPAMGGIAKGQIVREIDALGGFSGVVSDKSAIQFKMLNKSKGPAMWSPRTQNDRVLFSLEWRKILESLPNLHIWQDSVNDLIVEKKSVIGVKTELGISIYAGAVVLTNGTFLNGKIHVGEMNSKGGRIAERASQGITEKLNKMGFISNRMKTGTPPRIDGRSIDVSQLDTHPGDSRPEKFSFSPETKPLKKQRDCWMVYTNPQVHEIIADGFETSPMYLGRITGVAPRYCPSIEDKIKRFADKERHQLFIEPEGWNTCELYLNGFSTSLNFETQKKALQQIKGLENVEIFSPGYAIEYDFFLPTQLQHSLETKNIGNLFFAGQINGTTGYEEAACQGLMAGINAAQKIKGETPLILKRNEAYIGVLIDDLVTKGTNEPYRMFTSRAEFRLLLRQDNADVRLTPISYNQIKLASEERYKRVLKKLENAKEIQTFSTKTHLPPEKLNPVLEQYESTTVKEQQRLRKIISRPDMNFHRVMEGIDLVAKCQAFQDVEAATHAEIEIKYESYLKKELEMAERFSKIEKHKIPKSYDFSSVISLSMEARQKLDHHRPETLGQASRISGVSPADVMALHIDIEKKTSQT